MSSRLCRTALYHLPRVVRVGAAFFPFVFRTLQYSGVNSCVVRSTAKPSWPIPDSVLTRSLLRAVAAVCTIDAPSSMQPRSVTQVRAIFYFASSSVAKVVLVSRFSGRAPRSSCDNLSRGFALCFELERNRTISRPPAQVWTTASTSYGRVGRKSGIQCRSCGLLRLTGSPVVGACLTGYPAVGLYCEYSVYVAADHTRWKESCLFFVF